MIDGICIGDISIDCKDPARTREFYAALTGWRQEIRWDCPALITENGLVILFMPCDFRYRPPVWPERPFRQQKQMHLDFTVDDVPAAVEEALRLGASKPRRQYGSDRDYTLLDPEGHPFCLGPRRTQKSEFDLYYEQKGYGAIPTPSINIDCQNTKKMRVLREFYAQMTGWDQEFHYTALVAENRMVVHFMRSDFLYIPPVWPERPGRQQKQMHFNFQVNDLPAAVEEAIRLGAVKPKEQYGGEQYVTLLDPVGHPFCLCRK